MATYDKDSGRAGTGTPSPGFLHPHPEGRAGPHSHTPVENPDPSPSDVLAAVTSGQQVVLAGRRCGKMAFMAEMDAVARAQGLRVVRVGGVPLVVDADGREVPA